MRDTNFIYIDESITEKADLASLTGLIIPGDKFEIVRKEFYKVMSVILDYLYPNRDVNSIDFPPILHANSFLQNSKENRSIDFSNITDKIRIEVITMLVDIINNFNLKIVRNGYSNYKEVKMFTKGDEKLYSLNWFAISGYLDNTFEPNVKFICVMDGTNLNMIRLISSGLLHSNSIKELNPKIAKSLHLNFPNRFYGNVFYTPAKYSEFIQLVDLYSYLLQKRDYVNITGDTSVYSRKLIEIIEKVDKENISNEISTLDIYNA